MADSKITALASISTSTDPAVDPLVIVDISDTSMAASGTSKKVTLNNLLSSSPTATGNFTITGDLTVDTSTLKVDSTNNFVGIGTASPAVSLDIRGASAAATLEVLRLQNTGGGANTKTRLNFYAASTNYGSITGGFGASTPELIFDINTSTGEFIWNNLGSEAMRLNSTGLGIGVSPSYPLHVQRTSFGVTALFLTQDGTSNPRLAIYGSSSGTTIQNTWSSGASNLIFANGGSVGSGTEMMRIDSSGNVGIGNTPTTAWRAGARALQVGVSKYVSLHEQSNGSTNLAFSNYESAANVFSYTTGDAPTRYAQINGVHQWFTAAAGTANTVITFTQAMTLDAAGKLNIGNATGDVGLLFVRKDSLTDQVVQLQNEAATGKMITFHTNGNNQVGSISFTSSAVAYNTSSDYRLKESVKPISGGLARVNALKPSAYKWKVDGSNGEGFLAHELAEVVPFAVTGDKDAVDVDSKPAYQGVDLSKIVPILVAAIQELTAEVNALKNA